MTLINRFLYLPTFIPVLPKWFWFPSWKKSLMTFTIICFVCSNHFCLQGQPKGLSLQSLSEWPLSKSHHHPFTRSNVTPFSTFPLPLQICQLYSNDKPFKLPHLSFYSPSIYPLGLTSCKKFTVKIYSNFYKLTSIVFSSTFTY